MAVYKSDVIVEHFQSNFGENMRITFSVLKLMQF